MTNPLTLQAVEQAATRIAPYVVRTPLLSSPMLDEAASCKVFVKAEPLQNTGAFKLRGALNLMLSLSPQQLASGVITYSAGNHAQAVAAAAKLLGCKAQVVMPQHAPAIKKDSCRWWGADVVLYDAATEDRQSVLDQLMTDGQTFIPPFDHLDIMAGQGTIGLEIASQLAELGQVPDAVIVSCSGGGVSSGVITALQALHPQLHGYIAEAQGWEKMALSLKAASPQPPPAPQPTLMDGISGPTAGRLPLAALLACSNLHTLSISEQQARQGVSAAFRWLKLVSEPAGAAALGGLLSGRPELRDKTVVVVCSGGNVDPDVFATCLAEMPAQN
ncbi:MAG: pyridoxal-phosphate dependent enzyme [Burkholderiaceae bacterium]